MASARMPPAFFKLAAHHLPPEQPARPEGGRPPVSHRVVLNVLWFVLVTGCRWADVPPELGCSGMTAHRCLRRWEQMGCWDRLHADLLRLLRKAGIQLLLNRLAPNDRYAPFKYRDAER